MRCCLVASSERAVSPLTAVLQVILPSFFLSYLADVEQRRILILKHVFDLSESRTTSQPSLLLSLSFPTCHFPFSSLFTLATALTSCLSLTLPSLCSTTKVYKGREVNTKREAPVVRLRDGAEYCRLQSSARHQQRHTPHTVVAQQHARRRGYLSTAAGGRCRP